MFKVKNYSSRDILLRSYVSFVMFTLCTVIFLGIFAINTSYATTINSTGTVNSTINSFNQDPQVPSSELESSQTNLDLDSSISDLAYSLADYHYNLAKMEMDKGNTTGADYHANLAMMSLDEIHNMVKGNLNQENKDKILNLGPSNCVINKDGNVMCLP